MSSVRSSESPLETAAETVGERTAEAFKVLGNDSRLAILLALWEAKTPGPPLSEQVAPAVSFSALRQRVGIRDTGQFTYHLNRLVGTFVESTAEGYTLTPPAEQILSAVFAGTLTEHASIEGEPIDATCLNCGAQRVMDFSDGILIERCTSCAGVWQIPDHPPGIIAKLYRPPVGLVNRTPQEFQRHGNAWDRHREHLMMEGACPDCSGSITTTIHVCEEHDHCDGALCERCGTMFEIRSFYVCDICKNSYVSPVYRAIFTEMAVKAFFYERGLDSDALIDAFAWEVLHDAITDVTVLTAEPLEIGVAVSLDGDCLEVTLDDDAQVIDVTESVR